MTVLQQIRNYYLNVVPTNDAAKKLTEKLISPKGVKAHLTPEDYFAERIQRLETDETIVGRLLSEQV